MTVFRRRRSETDTEPSRSVAPDYGSASRVASARESDREPSNAVGRQPARGHRPNQAIDPLDRRSSPSVSPSEERRQTVESRVPPHVERALITLTAKMQNCVERLDGMERRLDELTEMVMNTPSHSDVLEVRLHSAKLAAELARSTVELRGEIGLASEEARRSLRSSRPDAGEVPVTLPVDVEIEKAEPIDLTNTNAHTVERQPPKGNWSQSA